MRYKDAQEDENLRQEFLDDFLKENKNKSVSKLVYVKNKQVLENFFKNKVENGEMTMENYREVLNSIENPEKRNKDVMEVLAFCPRNHIGRGKTSPVFITPECFKLSFEDFHAVLVDHEYIHADHIKNGIKFEDGMEYNYLIKDYFNSETIMYLDESIAYVITILNAIKKENFSPLIKDHVETLILINKNLSNKSRFLSTTEELVVKRQILKNQETIDLFSNLQQKPSYIST